ncbi:hypothetical protein F5Y15DRAFT_417062 [Xylariaceae sp. FL0016]|nr:hypothetical protein F5Y15DRAFT_417062 [Xylariaceae sp. FL0016]
MRLARIPSALFAFAGTTAALNKNTDIVHFDFTRQLSVKQDTTYHVASFVKSCSINLIVSQNGIVPCKESNTTFNIYSNIHQSFSDQPRAPMPISLHLYHYHCPYILPSDSPRAATVATQTARFKPDCDEARQIRTGNSSYRADDPLSRAPITFRPQTPDTYKPKRECHGVSKNGCWTNSPSLAEGRVTWVNGSVTLAPEPQPNSI